MPTAQLDTSIERKEIGSFRFPLGVYPVESLSPRPGFVLAFEPADGGDAGDDDDTFNDPHDTDDEHQRRDAPTGPSVGDWEEWPDRFMFDVLVSAERLPALVRALLSLLPGRLYPILDVLGNDAFREIDPYIAYDLVAAERFYDGFIMFQDWLLEDGLVGFGAMSMDPFIYIFVDEHKAVTIRAGLELKDELQSLLEAFDLSEVPEILGADAVAHEHRTVLARTENPKDGLHAEEIVERLRDPWLLQPNIDTTTNLDDNGNHLGVTPFRAVVRCLENEDARPVYAEVLLAASCHENAEALTVEAASANAPEDKSWLEVVPLFCDRFRDQDFARYAADAGVEDVPQTHDAEQTFSVRWFDSTH